MNRSLPTPPRRAVLIAAVVAVVAGVAVAGRPRTAARAAPLEARLELAAGAVGVDEGEGEHAGLSGSALQPGAKVRTERGSRALLRLSDGTSVFLRGGSTIVLGAEGISLDAGEVWIDAPASERKPPVHRLGAVTVSAEATGLSASREKDEVAVVVARGLAIVTGPGGRAEVRAGERVRFSNDAAPAVEPVAFWDDWTGGLGDHGASGSAGAGAGTLYGVDLAAAPGSPARTLEIARQSVHVVIRDGVAETEVDQTFMNPGERAVEGWYWFSIPEGATVTGFALETNGALVEGELIERKEAAAQYAVAVQRANDPALLEWIDRRTVRARIYPIAAAGTRRVVLRYLELLPLGDGRLRYVYPLRALEATRIGELSIDVDLGDEGTRMALTTLADARIEDGGRRVTMRRSGFTPRADFLLEARANQQTTTPLRISRFRSDGDSADYVMARWIPDVDWNEIGQLPVDVALVVDTSAGGDDASRRLKTAAAEAILRALSQEDRFVVVALDVGARVLHPEAALAPANDEEIARALEKLAEHSAGGASDLAALFDSALGRLHGSKQPAVVYVGDGWPTSGELRGEQLRERLERALSTSNARFYTVAAGADANLALLAELARAGGGQSWAVEDAEETTERALRLVSAVKAPALTDVEIDLGAGLDEVQVSASGKLTRGDELVLLARTHHDLPRMIAVKGHAGAREIRREYAATYEQGVASLLVPRLWAAERMRRVLGTAREIDSVRGAVIGLGLEYGLMTPFTSFLALDSERAFVEQGIQRRGPSRLRGPRLSALTPDRERDLLATAVWVGAEAVGFGCSRAADELAPASRHAQFRVKAPAAAGGGASPVAGAYQEHAAGVSAPEPPRSALAGAFGEGVFVAEGALSGRQQQPQPVAASSITKLLGLARDRGGEGKDGARADAQERALELDRGVCSDAARRPLHERALLWDKRLATAASPAELIVRYAAARSACELSNWRAESRFLDLLQLRLNDERAIAEVLAHFAPRPDARRHLARAILRRAVDPQIVAAVRHAVLGSAFDWTQVDRQLSEIADPAKRLARLRELLAARPEDPDGTVRLIDLLAANGERQEALVLARKIRDHGLLSPAIARKLGDLFVAEGLDEEALRTYSEVVEFDPRSSTSRRLLGDIFLSHRWYGHAYRQYATLTEASPADWSGWLRLAAAAAGSGRVDEALRLERKVAEAEGTPGVRDPRRWARLLSASRIARLLADEAPGAGDDPKKVKDALSRKLKELQLFSGPGKLVVLTWEDLGADLAVTTRDGGGEALYGDVTEAAEVGLGAVLLPGAGANDVKLALRARGAPGRAVPFVRHEIGWDGKSFSVSVERGEL